MDYCSFRAYLSGRQVLCFAKLCYNKAIKITINVKIDGNKSLSFHYCSFL